MASFMSADRLRFIINRFRERLWVKPLAVCLLSIAAVFIAKLADGSALAELAPEIAVDSIKKLLSIMSASMLVIATFSVTSMVSAYASASSTATPRSFTLVVADDASQNALSTFVGAFIFSVVGITAVTNNYFDTAGLFVLFALTIMVFGIVIMTFVRWVDRIARLGRMGSTIDKVELATAAALKRRQNAPRLCGVQVGAEPSGQAVFTERVGYVQHIDTAALQQWAEEADARLVVMALPGSLAAPGQPLAYIRDKQDKNVDIDPQCVIKAFQIGRHRLFDDDPRFGLVVLSEIASRALSPAVNDPGTAINVVGTLLRLLAEWGQPNTAEDNDLPQYDRVEVPEVTVRQMFDDAFTAIGRDGAAMVEVSVRLQKALHSLASTGDAGMSDAAKYHGRLALKRAEIALNVEEDLEAVRGAAVFAALRASS
ncbi:putative membrane protein [Spongiibacter sp. IMCC21906]|uniref:DUF2254 domain-containing protein n=1 Tax=Spongiibacter sp. IMCC21906 TaxID=1620392 RepID=UPI00062DEBA6|nr:DUF2254 domain-containing protein [Spongiibacter sp. IMCC21906]AKH70007.1 putative membrane protein [Spongiibacter sp. IMCC21906]